MKKNIILSTAAILAGCLFISSCGDVANEFIAPKDTWVYKNSTKTDNSFTYTWGEGENKKSVNFDLYVNYATKDETLKFNTNSADVKSGVNVILVPSANNDDNQKNYLKELLNRTTGVDNIAMFKSFGEQSEASESESDTGKSISLSGIWTLVYNFNRFESMGSKSISNTVSDLTLITDVKNLNWKRVLYNMLGEKLFSEN